jgi:putative redox protein
MASAPSEIRSSAAGQGRITLEVSFPGGVAVDATVHGHAVHTDQPLASGGGDSGPAPFDLFLASIATCAGFYALRFCQERGLLTDGLTLTLTPVRDETRRLSLIRLDLKTPAAFPEKYRDALVRAVDHCAVKRAIMDPPTFDVHVN